MSHLLKEVRAVINRKELLWQMVGREVKARYKQSILGYFWVILNPLAQMLVMTFAFSVILRIPTHASESIPYSVFLFSALLPWTLFSNSLLSSANALVGSASLITKIYFPRTILVISTIVAKIIDFLFATTILIAFMVYYQVPINLNILWVIPIFFIQQIFTLGISLFVSASNLLYRDIQYLLNLLITLWFYVTPIVYPIDIVPDNLRFVYQLNPMSVIINAYRQTILGGNPPSYNSMAIAILVSTVTLLLGLLYFKEKEKIFADNV